MAEEAHLPRDEIAATSPVASEAGNPTLPPSRTGSPPSTEVGIIPSTLSLIERIARDPTIDIDRLERMLAFQERLMARQAEMNWHEAMNRCQEEIQLKMYDWSLHCGKCQATGLAYLYEWRNMVWANPYIGLTGIEIWNGSK